jgi:hypothetical protein
MTLVEWAEIGSACFACVKQGPKMMVPFVGMVLELVPLSKSIFE